MSKTNNNEQGSSLLFPYWRIPMIWIWFMSIDKQHIIMNDTITPLYSMKKQHQQQSYSMTVNEKGFHNSFSNY